MLFLCLIPARKLVVMRSRAQHKETEALIPVTSSKQSSCLHWREGPASYGAGLRGRAGRCRRELLLGAAGLGTASGLSRELRTEVRGNGAGIGVFNLLCFVRNQLGVDSSRDGRVGGPAFHFRWSPRSLSGPQGPRERVGGRGLGAGSGRGGAAAAAELSEPMPRRRVSPRLASPRRPPGVQGRVRSPTAGPCPLPPH